MIRKSSEHHKKVRILRKYARRKLPKLVKKQGGKCYYCGDEIILKREVISNISKKDIIKIDGIKVTLFKNNQLTTIKFATSEHLTRIVDGGDSSLENLVAACYYCNSKKDQEFNEPRREYNNQNCKRCGNKFNGKSYCKDCKNFYKEFYMLLRKRKEVMDYLRENKNDYY